MSEKNINKKIVVKDATKIFGKSSGRAIQLLKDGKTKSEILKATGATVGVKQVSFEVNEGEIFVIMGLSGSGKSTLVRLLNRLIDPTMGQILLDGKDIVQMNKEQLREVRRKKIGMVFQNFALFPHKTIVENTEYGLEIQGVSKKERNEKAIESLRLVGLAGYEDQYPKQLSGGMQQRVGLARALANNPDILLMDEAFSALDPLIRKDMQNELLQLHHDMQKTIIFITHDLDEALRIGDRIALMKDGEIVQIGSPEEILMSPSNEYVERFVEDVDLSKVLTAGHIMKKADTVKVDRGPRVALRLMKHLGISSIYVVDNANRLLGAVTAQDTVEAIESEKSLNDVIISDLPMISPDTVLTELFDVVSTASIPVAVINEEQKLQGIIIRGALIGALSGDNEFINKDGTMDSAEQHITEVI
ncbi:MULTISPECIES: glycine betaine/L-proline ABC transporter ATP-binding protein [Bacillaceae]|uniref:quaternary amine ABC transporter ATP-binding protein n=1 Tax=Bacillaceae TaxID=186817 RepID=UPI0006AE7360|nr:MULTISPECIES: glycine betaine/L-proline ABC transporter ATP-binding protein [Bacillaceae]ALC86915.1 glycine/betaine ABC transporter ATP-binding protein [Bacillus sp. FJAT-22090]KQL37387.1 glycine/betaine ABC transporter ATP-binding protein [Psychrobacillus sp. FJAT-21963]MDF2068669.1 glycine betaine/L-proline ABC transporter ATP-binding protein [Bacillus sp. Cr_A10]